MITKYQDGSLKGFSKSYEGNPLDKVDIAFYDLEKDSNLIGIMARFIRQQKADFINK